jgi:hypothetical protein
MKMLARMTVVLVIIVLLASVAGAKRTYKGSAVQIGSGRAYAWVRLNIHGDPISVGITMTGGALSGILERKGREWALPMPPEAAATGIEATSLIWYPNGRGVLTAPYFNFHFSLIPERVRDVITGAEEDEFARQPGSRYIPRGYKVVPGGIPRVGRFWADSNSSMFGGRPFNAEFAYGFYNGRMASFDPMVTLAYLQTRQDVTGPISRPATYPGSGYYPDTYNVSYDAGRDRYTVSIEGLRRY